ncbi:hypothetical protein ACFQJD_07010 [Haloplanus sp. GCM10025708]|uniref:hypothetical protein n=1 Tax=Haloferacaceae TaxID=1644056 RepID=UPI00360AC539
MTLDVDVPMPPDLTNRGVPAAFEAFDVAGSESDFRREAVETALRDGAWREGFDEWCEYTDLSEDEFRALDELGLFRAFDFYWGPEDERLQYEAPDLPADWREQLSTDAVSTLESEAESGGVDSRVNAELDELGHTVLETLDELYADWSDRGEDVVWDAESFGHGTTERESLERE